MKRIVSCALAALLAVSLLAVPALAIDLEPGTGDGFYVVDRAGVLSTETEDLVAAYNATILEPACDSAQLVVATVSYLDEDSDLAATELLNDWGVGSASRSNGMLLLLVTEEYRGWLAVGQGLSRAFDDDMAGQYLDAYFWDYIDKNQFDEGVQTLTEKLVAWYADYYDVDLAAYADTNSQAYNDYAAYNGYGSAAAPARSTGGMSIFTVVFFVLFLLLILWIIGAASRFSRMRRWGYTGGFFPIFWFGGRRRYNDWYRRQPPPPPGPGPGPGGPAGFGGPGGFMGGGFGRPRSTGRTSTFSRPSAPRGSGFGGVSRGGGAGRRSGGSFRSGGGFHGGGHGGGFGGHSGGGGAGRR